MLKPHSTKSGHYVNRNKIEDDRPRFVVENQLDKNIYELLRRNSLGADLQNYFGEPETIILGRKSPGQLPLI
jgi:hypothetical protein